MGLFLGQFPSVVQVGDFFSVFFAFFFYINTLLQVSTCFALYINMMYYLKIGGGERQ